MSPSTTDRMRLAAMGDLHVGEDDRGRYRDVFAQVSAEADVLALCGDLTNFGTTREAVNLAEDLRACTIPVVGVLGNHDYECDQPSEVSRILHEAGVQLLDRLHAQAELPAANIRVCRGRLLSPRDYVTDISEWGFADVVGKGLEERHEPINH